MRAVKENLPTNKLKLVNEMGFHVEWPKALHTLSLKRLELKRQGNF